MRETVVLALVLFGYEEIFLLGYCLEYRPICGDGLLHV